MLLCAVHTLLTEVVSILLKLWSSPRKPNERYNPIRKVVKAKTIESCVPLDLATSTHLSKVKFLDSKKILLSKAMKMI